MAGRMLLTGPGYARSINISSTQADKCRLYLAVPQTGLVARSRGRQVEQGRGAAYEDSRRSFLKARQDRNYRSYKLQFQAPNGVGLFTWKVYLVSDTFVGEEICEDIAVGVILRSLNISDPDTFPCLIA